MIVSVCVILFRDFYLLRVFSTGAESLLHFGFSKPTGRLSICLVRMAGPAPSVPTDDTLDLAFILLSTAVLRRFKTKVDSCSRVRSQPP